MAYVTLEEAAALENIEYFTFTKRLERNPEKYETITEPSPTGGKPRVKVAVGSLSKKAQNIYKKQQEITLDITSMRTDEEAVPWYVDCDFNMYIENNKESYYKAVELTRAIEDFNELRGKGRTERAKEMAEKLGMSIKNFYRYREKYLEGSAWAIKREAEDGYSYDVYKVLALCRKPSKINKFPSISEPVKVLVQNIWFNQGFARNQGTVELLYDYLQDMCKEKGYDYPSYKTIARYVRQLTEENRNAHFLVTYGERVYKNKVMVKRERNTKSVPVMGLVQGDEHTFDFWVKYKYPNGNVKAIRPTLIAWIDTRSRKLLGSMVCVKANSQVLKQSMIKLIYEAGVPEYLLIDNGKDYTAETMTGHNRRERSTFDAECKGFYRAVGIKDSFRALPYQAWTKGEIERFFGGVCSKFSKRFESYTGTMTGSKTSAKIKKDIDGMLERDELIDFSEVLPMFEKWLEEKYNCKVHSKLKEIKDEYFTPGELFEKCSEKYVKAPPPKEYASMLLMKAEHVRVYNVGIKKFGYTYNSIELAEYIGQNVDIRYDETDVTKLYVFDSKTGRKLCEAVSQELLMIAPRVPQKALEEHLKMQKQQLKQDREKAKYYAMPLEERVEEQNNASYGRATGALDLMIHNENPKVVAMVQDRQFSEDVKEKKTRKADKRNEFLAEQGRKKLREIG